MEEEGFCSFSLIVDTPYSMNSLFSEFFREFSGVILEVWDYFGVILEVFWQDCEGKMPDKLLEKQEKYTKTLFFYYLNIALNRLFVE